jgi:hypothetical protein
MKRALNAMILDPGISIAQSNEPKFKYQPNDSQSNI